MTEKNKFILFSLENCERCEFIKKRIPKDLDIEIKTYPHELKEWTPEQIAEAVYYEVYSDLQNTAPILLLPDGTKLKSVVEIKNKLKDLEK
jgi:hypothetical protein